MSTPSHIKQLDHIRQLLTHPAADREDILRRVQKILVEVGYERHPYDFVFPRVCRAASKTKESWFVAEDGKTALPEKLHCPPDNLALEGRCNWAGDSVFYCSTENGVPVFEVRAKLDETLVISHWVNKVNTDDNTEQHPIRVKGIAFGVKKIVASLKDGDPLKDTLLQDDIFKASTPQAIKEVDEYIGQLFIESANEVKRLYSFTSSIARAIFKGMRAGETGLPFNGLVYPSVEGKFSGQNIALSKDFARNELKLLGAAMYKVVEYDSFLSKYSLKPVKGLRYNKENGRPIWVNVHPKHDSLRFVLSPETQTLPFDKDAVLCYEDE